MSSFTSSTTSVLLLSCVLSFPCFAWSAIVSTYQANNCIQARVQQYDGSGDGICAINKFAGLTFSGQLICNTFTSASSWELKAFNDQSCTQAGFDVTGGGNASCIQAVSNALGAAVTVYNQVDCGRYLANSFSTFDWAVNSSITTATPAPQYACNPNTCCCFNNPVYFNASTAGLTVNIATSGTCGQQFISFQTALFGELPQVLSVSQLNNYTIMLNRWGDQIIIQGTNNTGSCQTMILNTNPAKFYYPPSKSAATWTISHTSWLMHGGVALMSLLSIFMK